MKNTQTLFYFFSGLFLFLLSPTLIQAQTAELPKGYEEFRFGQSLKEVKELLRSSASLYWMGDPDVTMLAQPNTSLLEVQGSFFVKRGAFQFVDDKLFSIALTMNEKEIDYISLFDQLNKKYGRPKSLNPEKALWEDPQTALSLEKPMIIRYVHQPVLQELQKNFVQKRSIQFILREKFLETL